MTTESLSSSAGRLWDGYYINMDRSTDRRRRTEEELRRHGLEDRYQRFPAVDGRVLGRPSPLQPGEVGVFRSHLDLLKKIAASGRHAHVLEDDEVLCDLTAPAVDTAVRRRIADEFDLLFPETHLGKTLSSLRTFRGMFEQVMRTGGVQRPEQLQVLDIGDNYDFGLFSYVIGPRGVDRLIPALDREWERGPTLPIDLVVRDEAKAGRLRLGCLFPFVTAPHFDSIRVNATTQLDDRDRAMILPMIRYSYFVRRDLGYVETLLDEVLARLHIDDSDEAIELRVKVLERLMRLPERPARR